MAPELVKALQNLSDRPNVESTLILSRRDGSIINASGVLASKNAGHQAQASYSRMRNIQSAGAAQRDEEINQASADADAAGIISKEYTPTAAERVAESIFEFVRLATNLNSKLESTQKETEFDRADRIEHTDAGKEPLPEADEDNESRESSKNRDEQLITMRTRRKEVVILADARFLCCVIHNATKQGPKKSGS